MKAAITKMVLHVKITTSEMRQLKRNLWRYFVWYRLYSLVEIRKWDAYLKTRYVERNTGDRYFLTFLLPHSIKIFLRQCNTFNTDQPVKSVLRGTVRKIIFFVYLKLTARRMLCLSCQIIWYQLLLTWKPAANRGETICN